MKIIIKSDRLKLREFTMDDVDALASVIEKIEINKYKNLSLFDYTYGFLKYRTLKSYKENGFGLWAVILKRTRKLVGYCGLHKIKVNGENRVELAYKIKKEFRRQGFASEAAIAVRDYGFNTLGLSEIISCIAHDNIASIKVAEKVGMKYTNDGEFHGNPRKIYQITH